MIIRCNFHNISELIVFTAMNWSCFSHWSLKNKLEETCFFMKLRSSFSFPLLLPWLYRSRIMERPKTMARNFVLFQRIYAGLYRIQSINNKNIISNSFDSNIDVNRRSPGWCSAGQWYAPHRTSCRQYLQCSVENQVSIVVLNVILQI